MMIRLVEETVRALELHGKRPSDVLWVGSRCGAMAMPWRYFADAHCDLCYDNGYGHQHIPEDLVVVGSGWWLERYEHDGAEAWHFKVAPIRQRTFRPFRVNTATRGLEAE